MVYLSDTNMTLVDTKWKVRQTTSNESFHKQLLESPILLCFGVSVNTHCAASAVRKTLFIIKSMHDLIGNDLLIVTSDLIELKLTLAFQSDEDSWNQEEKLLTHATDVCSWISVFSYCWRNTCKRNPWQMKTDPEIWAADRPVDHNTGRFSTLLSLERPQQHLTQTQPVETESRTRKCCLCHVWLADFTSTSAFSSIWNQTL